MKQYHSMLFVVLTGSLCLAAQSQTPSPDANRRAQKTASSVSPAQEDFEVHEVPASWKGIGDSDVSITAERFKTGVRSLRWTWSRKDQSLVFHNPSAFAMRDARSVLGLWVHSETPLQAPMRVDVLNDSKVVASCWFWMNFKGWRPLVASYKEIGCDPQQTIESLRFHVPDGIPSGRLCFDAVELDNKKSISILRNTYQMPWSPNPQDGLRHPESVVLSDTDIRCNRPWLPPRETVTPKEREEMAVLAERFLPSLVRPAKGLAPSVLVGLRQWMAKYRIEYRDDRVSGRPVGTGPCGIPNGALDMPDWDWLRLCSNVQEAYFRANKPEEVSELRRMFVALSAHLIDQGFAEGVQIFLAPNYPPGGVDSFFYMRDVLAEAGLARDMALALAYYFGEAGQCLAREPKSSMDSLGYWNVSLIPCYLMLPDEAERLQRLRTVQRFFDLVLVNPNVIAPDGCTYHHSMFHFAYANYNMPRALRVFEKLSGTSFRISPEAHVRLKTFAKAIAFTLSGDQQAYNLAGRAGEPLNGNMAGFSKSLALMGTPDGKQTIDPEMAALYLTQTDKWETEPAKTWIAQGITPLPLTGHLTMNGSPLAVHRRADWLVNIAGISKFWTGVEIYGWTYKNNYGRYARNGSICVTSNGKPASLTESGWTKAGWNWCHFPGATNPQRPSYEIFDGWAYYGNRSTAGGTQLGEDGVWGMDFSGSDDVHFKRSAFCFDNRITVLTSDINSASAWPMVTTLFQNSLQTPGETVCVDGKTVADFPVAQTISAAKPHWLIDNKGTGYLIPSGQGTVQLSCRRQSWTYWIPEYLIDPDKNPLPNSEDYHHFKLDRTTLDKYYRPSTGNFALAWFDHGKAPQNASCAYTIVVRATPEKMKMLAENVPYSILQQNGNIHALYDCASKTTGYVLFAANSKIEAKGFLKANSLPCLVMICQDGKHLRISVACTDIKRTEPIRLKLQGTWKTCALPAEPLTVTAIGNDTQIEVQPNYYMPMRFELKTASQEKGKHGSN